MVVTFMESLNSLELKWIWNWYILYLKTLNFSLFTENFENSAICIFQLYFYVLPKPQKIAFVYFVHFVGGKSKLCYKIIIDVTNFYVFIMNAI